MIDTGGLTLPGAIGDIARGESLGNVFKNAGLDIGRNLLFNIGGEAISGVLEAVLKRGKSAKATVEDFIANNVNPIFQQNVKEAFLNDAKVTVLKQDVTVYRYHGSSSQGISYWYTPNQTSNPAAYLALPQGNIYHVEDYGSQINYSLAFKKYAPEKKARIVSDILSTAMYIMEVDGLDAEKIEEIAQSVKAKSYIEDEIWNMAEHVFRGAVMGVNTAVAGKYYTGQAGGGKHSLSNVEARRWYLEQEAKIPDMIDKSLTLEEQAKQAFNLRNQFRTQARELMADRATAESLYKIDPNLTWEEIVRKQSEKGLEGDDIYKAIIESSQRSRKSVNKSLGLE